MIIFVGASASGKTEIAKNLIKDYNYKKIITTTTRPIRETEVDGVDYHFTSKEIFEFLIEDDLLVEHAMYQDEYYGVQRKDLIENGIVILEPTGANFIINNTDVNPYVVYIESSEANRHMRMLGRGDRTNTILERLESDKIIFAKENISKVDLHLFNDDLTIEQLSKIIDDNYKLSNK